MPSEGRIKFYSAMVFNKLPVVVLTLAVCLCVLGTLSSDGDDSIVRSTFSEDDFLYEINSDVDHTVSVIDYTGSALFLTVPDSVMRDGVQYFVTSIADGAFRDCRTLCSVIIGSGIVNIGTDVFEGCTSLESIIVSSSNVNYLSSNGILYDKLMTSMVHVPIMLGGDVTIPDTVTRIEDFAFENHIKLTSVTIGSGVKKIGGYAFSGCSGLTSVTIGHGVETLGNGVFKLCTSLVSITIPDNVTDIQSFLFLDCSELRHVKIGDGISHFGDDTFRNCTSLVTVSLGKNVSTIGFDPFFGCVSLESISVSNDNTNFTSKDGILYNKEMTLTYHVPQNLKGGVVIPDSITVIGNNMFADRVNITSIDIGNGVVSIGASAFRGCSKLVSLKLGTQVHSIGDDAFSGCKELSSIVVDDENVSFSSHDGILYNKAKTRFIHIPLNLHGDVSVPQGITEIGDMSFNNRSMLVSVTLPDGLTRIGSNAFYGCSGLKSIFLPNSVTMIDTGAFMFCTGIISMDIPEGVTVINNGTFHGCSSIVTIGLGNGITSIGNGAFSGCSSLISLNIPASVSSIGNGAFDNCKSILEFTISANVSFIGIGAFGGCSSLVSIDVDGNNTMYASQGGILYDKAMTELLYVPIMVKGVVTIPDGITRIPERAFEGRSEMTSIVLGSGIDSLGPECFKDTLLKTFTVPKSITVITYGVFSGCTMLEKVTFESTVTKICDSGFLNCPSLRTIVLNGGDSIFLEYVDEASPFSGCPMDLVMRDGKDGHLIRMYSDSLMTKEVTGKDLSDGWFGTIYLNWSPVDDPGSEGQVGWVPYISVVIVLAVIGFGAFILIRRKS